MGERTREIMIGGLCTAVFLVIVAGFVLLYFTFPKVLIGIGIAAVSMMGLWIIWAVFDMILYCDPDY